MQYILGGVTGGLGKVLSDLTRATAVSRQQCDLGFDASVESWATSLYERTHIINLAGVSRNAMLHKGNEQDWADTVQVNLIGNMRLIKHCRSVFKEHPGSTLTLVGSVTTHSAPAGTGVYTATKSALEGLTRVASREYAPFARVNLLELGYYDQGMIKQVDTTAIVKTIPLGRLGTANDLWEAWKFIIACQYVTGSIIPVNGGLA